MQVGVLEVRLTPTRTTSALLQVLAALAVVVGDGVVQRLDAVEVVGVEGVLGADPVGELGAEIAAEAAVRGSSAAMQGISSSRQPASSCAAQLAVDDGVQDHAGRLLDLLQHPVQLPGRADQGVDVLDRQHVVEAGADRLGDGVQRLSRGIGDEMDVEVGRQALRRLHDDKLSKKRWDVVRQVTCRWGATESLGRARGTIRPPGHGAGWGRASDKTPCSRRKPRRRTDNYGASREIAHTLADRPTAGPCVRGRASSGAQIVRALDASSLRSW